MAELMAKSISEEQPNLGATAKDVLCVKLAGLLHDIGHGPYSHLYEQFRNHALPAYLEANPELLNEYKDCEGLKVPKGWSHEQSSMQMLDAALEELGLQIDLNNLDKPLKQIGDGVDANSMKVFKPPGVEDSILTSRDWVFIKECILGEPLPEIVQKFRAEVFIGRTQEHKEWLYDIVNNRHSGLDVDKADYFARDFLRAMGSRSNDIKMIEDARVAKTLCNNPFNCIRCKGVAGKHHFMICYPLKRVEAAMNFFKKRLYLHTVIYQHKKTVAVGAMLCDILCLADPYFRLETDDGERYPISRAVLKSDYLKSLDDNVLSLIYHSKDPKLAEARALFRNLKRHKIYKCAVDCPLDIESMALNDMEGAERQAIQDSKRDRRVWAMSDKQIKDGMMLEKNRWKEASGVESEALILDANDFVIEKFYMHHGRRDKNPLSGMRFFDEMNEKLIGPIEDLPIATECNYSHYSSIIPVSLQKAGVRIFCREESKRGLVNHVFLQWFERIGRSEAAEQPGMTPFIEGVKLEPYEGSDEEDDEDEDMGDNNHALPQPAVLSQESVDSGDEDESRCHPAYQSPIPVRTRY